jgi:hypothetical protein
VNKTFSVVLVLQVVFQTASSLIHVDSITTASNAIIVTTNVVYSQVFLERMLGPVIKS